MITRVTQHPFTQPRTYFTFEFTDSGCDLAGGKVETAVGGLVLELVRSNDGYHCNDGWFGFVCWTSGEVTLRLTIWDAKENRSAPFAFAARC